MTRLTFHPPPTHDPKYNMGSYLEVPLFRPFKFWFLKPTVSTTPPCLFSPPTMIRSLTNDPKSSTPPSIFRSYSQEIIQFLQNPTLCFTDGNKIGFTFSVEDITASYRQCNSALMFTTELQAIYNCLELILTLSSSPSILFRSFQILLPLSTRFPILFPCTLSLHVSIFCSQCSPHSLSTSSSSEPQVIMPALLHRASAVHRVYLWLSQIVASPRLSPHPHDYGTALSDTSPSLSNISPFLHQSEFLSRI